MKKAIRIAAIAAIVLIALLAWKIQRQRAALSGPPHGSAVIEGTTWTLSSRVGGRIISLAVDEGDKVKQGDMVAKLDCQIPQAHLAQASATLEAAHQGVLVATAQVHAAQRRQAGARDAADAARASLLGQQTTADATSRQAARIENVRDDLSAVSVDKALTRASASAAQVMAAKATADAMTASMHAAQSAVEAALASKEASEAQVKQATAARTLAEIAVDDCAIVAPHAGTIEHVLWEVGELVRPQVGLLTMVDLSRVTASFYVPNRELGAVAVGDAAHVVADAWPSRTFDGTVRRIARHAEFTPRNIQTRTDRDRLVYKVEIELVNPDEALRPGMPVEVQLISDGAP